MSARHFILRDKAVRARCAAYVLHEAPDDWEVLAHAPTMTGGQKARFHALCGDIAASGLEFAGRQRTPAEWKALLISGHATATGEGAELVEGIEGELVNVRESTTIMSRRRGASLIEYSTAFAAMRGVRLRAPEQATA